MLDIAYINRKFSDKKTGKKLRQDFEYLIDGDTRLVKNKMGEYIFKDTKAQWDMFLSGYLLAGGVIDS